LGDALVRAEKSQSERQSTKPSIKRVSQSTSARASVGNRPKAAAQFSPQQRKSPNDAWHHQKHEPPSRVPLQLQHEPTPPKNNTGLPDHLKSGIESLSGVSLDNVKVHYNSAQPAQLSALAYARGTDIHVAPGEERCLPHEAWHVVQQAQGRVKPQVQMKDAVPINDEQGLEREADVMGQRAAAAGHVAVFSRRSQVERAEVHPPRDVIQPWWDQYGKFQMGAKPSPIDEWEQFEFGPSKQVRWRPKKGTATGLEAQAQELKAKEENKNKMELAEKAADERALDWEAKSTDYKAIFYEDPAHILYTQDSIASTFTSGKTIQSLVTALKNGTVLPSSVEPIMVELFDGKLYSYDNRRLWAFKKAKLNVRCRFASQKERENNAFKLTGDDKKITIRK
jgi:hypothetical protein